MSTLDNGAASLKTAATTVDKLNDPILEESINKDVQNAITADVNAKLAQKNAAAAAEAKTRAAQSNNTPVTAEGAGAATTVDENGIAEIVVTAKKIDPQTTEGDSEVTEVKNEGESDLDKITSSAIEQNILNQYENPTYHLKLFMTKESATAETMSVQDIFVIAESGTTAGYNIASCRIDSVISPNFRTKNTLATAIDITLIEPLGSTLLDKIRLAARSLGVKDHVTAPMWLEVTFIGYNGPEDKSYEGGDTIIRSESRLFKMITRNVSADVTAGGTEYKMNFVPTNETAFYDGNRRLEESVIIKADTVGDFFDQLSKKLTIKKSYTTADVAANVFPSFKDIFFTFPTEGPGQNMKDWKLRGDDKQKNIKSEGTKVDENSPTLQVVTAEGTTSVTFDRGSSIESIVELVIGSTTEGQSYAILGKESGVTDEKTRLAGRNAETPAIIFNVDPTVELASYNAAARDYNRVFTYNIRAWKTFQPMVSVEQVKKSMNNTPRFQNIMKATNLKKRYEYIYSGLNTEVLDFKLRFDRAWFMQLPIYGGQDRSQVTSGTIIDKDTVTKTPATATEASKDLETPIDQKTQQIDKENADDDNNASTSNSKENEISQETAAERLSDTSVSQIDISQQETSLSFFGANQVIPISNDISRFSTLSNPRSEQATRNVTPSNTTGSIYFVEDLDSISVGRHERSLGDTNDPNQLIRDVKAKVATTESTASTNIEGTSEPGRTLFAAVMSQSYGMQADMIQISMEIRGDPYWLGEPNTELRLQQSGKQQDITNAQASFIFTMAYPTTPDDTGANGTNYESHNGTGLMEINRVQNGFNGVYTVRQVVHTFEGGKFTQKLEAYVDPLTKEQDVIEVVNNISIIQ